MVKQFNIQELISNPFNRADYIRFLKTLFEIKLENQSLEVTGQYSEYIHSGEYLGDYELNREKIHLYIINLKNKSVERARVFQRNFIAGDLRNHGAENALVVFYNEDQWRISFVKREKIEGKEQQLSAKRYSFFVGENEINNTCVQRINLLLKKDKPSIKDIEEAFSVEKVKDEFFKEYKSLFDELYKEIKKLRSSDNLINEEFSEKNISEEDFAKKILGQIVFLYFLQKKGWLGIERDPITKKFGEFGEGDQNFLQRLYEIAKKRKKNFFNDYLEKLFYKALATDRKADKYSFELDGEEWKIPFLNGGLFEPIGEYDWGKTDIIIPNNLFSNSNNNGILDVFNKYNFTIREDEPMEKEVAIDPEMLGKVFENLLETKERKSTGSFYTPREIVHYMCQQSLINYLETNTSIKKDILEKFVLEDCSLDMPKGIMTKSQEIDNLLKNIKVVDPAVGSGAFLVGIMTEIVKVRSYLNPNKKIFDLKKECIENSLHGVDIAPGAVDICQLRLWLSLVVDEENYGDVKPLPNLDYKIMCGNSLIEDYKGMKLWDDKWIGIKKEVPNKLAKIKEIDIKINKLKSKMPYLINKKNEKKNLEKQIKKLEKEKKEMMKGNGKNLELFMSESTRKLEMLKSLHEKFTHINDRAEKQEYKKKIETATIELIKSKLKEEGKESEFEDLKQIIQKKRAIPFFLWKMNFIDVFQRENPGFDVVIANPPYVSVKGLSSENKKDLSAALETGEGRFNLFTLFLEKGHKILKQKAVLTFIIPEGIYTNVEYRHIREYLLKKSKILYSVLFDYRLFEASVDTTIISIKNCIPKIDDFFPVYKNLKEFRINLKQIELSDYPFSLFPVSLTDKTKRIIEKVLSGGESLSKLLEVQQGIIYSGQPKEKVFSNKKDNDSFKKVLDGRDILKWRTNWQIKKENKFIKYTNSLHRPREERIFLAEEKLLLPRKSTKIYCAYDSNKFYTLNTAYIMLELNEQTKLKYILACLNSKLVNFYYTSLFFGWQITIPALNSITIPKILSSEQKPFIEKVDKILNITKDEDYLTNDSKKEKVQEIEKEIDQMVYKLYELTPEEIKIVEEFGK
jgi:hypothetical protein